METQTVWLKGRISSDGARLFTGMRLKAVAALNGSFAGIWVVAAFEASSDNPNSNPNQGKFRFMHQLFSSSGTAYILDCNWLQLFNHGQVDLNTCCKHCTYGSVSRGRGKCHEMSFFFLKVELSCGQTVKDKFDFSIVLSQLYLLHHQNTSRWTS